jgi:hypothetical protein
MTDNNLSQELLELKQEIEEAQQQANKAQGAYEQIMKQIKKDFACNNLEQVDKLLKELESKERRLKQEYETELNKFKKKWKDKTNYL